MHSRWSCVHTRNEEGHRAGVMRGYRTKGRVGHAACGTRIRTGQGRYKPATRHRKTTAFTFLTGRGRDKIGKGLLGRSRTHTPEETGDVKHTACGTSDGDDRPIVQPDRTASPELGCRQSECLRVRAPTGKGTECTRQGSKNGELRTTSEGFPQYNKSGSVRHACELQGVMTS